MVVKRILLCEAIVVVGAYPLGYLVIGNDDRKADSSHNDGDR